MGRSLVVNLDQFKGHFKFPENCSLREETLLSCFEGQDCADIKRIGKTQEKHVHTMLAGIRMYIRHFWRRVGVKAWQAEAVALYFGFHRLMAVFNAQLSHYSLLLPPG